MPLWKEYQEEAAGFYRSLGMDAQTDQRIDGVRGVHDVDVAVRGKRAGVEFLWIVECKRWSRPIPKEKVAALSSIVGDIGADRGILLSEIGFQSGAIRAARQSNVTLSSLAELREDSEAEVTAYQVGTLRHRVKHDLAEIDRLTKPEILRYRGGGGGGIKHHLPKGWTSSDHLTLIGRLSMIASALDRAESGRWPVAYTVVGQAEKEVLVRAEVLSELLVGIEGELSEIENTIRLGDQ